MMNLAQLEKNLASTNLDQFKTEPLELLVKQLYKYQDFKITAVLKQINMLNFKPNTVKQYYGMLRRYLKSGIKEKSFTQFYTYIDELTSVHSPILTPSQQDRVTEYRKNTQKSSKTSPITTPVELQKVEPPKYIEKIPPQYGIRCGDWIRLQPSKEMALGYIECYKVIGDGKPVELVAIDLEVQND